MNLKLFRWLAVAVLLAVVAGCTDDGNSNNSNEMVELMTSQVIADSCGCLGDVFEVFTNQKIKLYIDTANTVTMYYDSSMYSQYKLHKEDNLYFSIGKIGDFVADTVACGYFNKKQYVNICNFPKEELSHIKAPSIIEVEFSGIRYYFDNREYLLNDNPNWWAMYLTSFKISKSILNGGKK